MELADGEDFSLTLSRAKFEDLCKDLWLRCIKPLDDVLESATLSKNEIDEIVLVGGSCRIPKVQELLTTYFNGKTLNKSLNMDEAIAYGATVKASQLSGQNQESRDLLLQDVTPLSLGVEDMFHNMAVVVPKNTRIPFRMTKPAVPQFSGQSNVIIDIYQGERPKAKDNHKVGGFTMSVDKRSDLVLNVTFTIDMNGLLEVTAEDPVTRQRASVSITSDKLNLNDREI